MDIFEFISQKFRHYYLKSAHSISPPPEIEKREFGLVPFKREKKIMIRHKGFENIFQLRDFLKAVAPSDVYYSSAYYDRPGAETMADKNWKGADLVFDIDCDHISTPCKIEHDTWRCLSCGMAQKGQPPEKCPKCSSEKLDEENWVCEICLDIAKTELLKVVEMLARDLGLESKHMEAVFSGHRGYHVHVLEPEVKQLNASERKEIVDYVTGTGLVTNYHIKAEKHFAEMEGGWGA
ncbi:MAG: DNA primase small subunit domain-containing protein, partial [Candidatus Bathyarchaeia archaeon]